jgi:hypothetical protein
MDPVRKALAIKDLRFWDADRSSNTHYRCRLRALRSLTLLATDEPACTRLHSSAKDARKLSEKT